MSASGDVVLVGHHDNRVAFLMQALEECARERGLSSVLLSSQVSAIPFYERLGYRADGPVYEDAGIPHRDMEKQI